MARRRFLAQIASWPLAAFIPLAPFSARREASLKIVLKRSSSLVRPSAACAARWRKPWYRPTTASPRKGSPAEGG